MTNTQQSFNTFFFQDISNDIFACVAVDHPLGDRKYVLASVKLLERSWQDGDAPKEVKTLLKQLLNLKRKVTIIDKLELSDIIFNPTIAVGRVFIWKGADVETPLAWEFAANCISQVEKHLNVRFITQPDYDQMDFKGILDGVLGSIDFKLRHIPSALGTCVAFETILENQGIRIADTAWGILGIGNVGSRIVKILLEKQVSRILIYDVRESVLTPFREYPQVTVFDYPELLSANIDCLVFCAYGNSLTEEVAEKCVANPQLTAVGGPEAGLDHDPKILSLLSKAGKQFVPSLLSGSLGLVASLEESLHYDSDLVQLDTKLKQRVKAIAQIASKNGSCFQEAFYSYIYSDGSAEFYP